MRDALEQLLFHRYPGFYVGRHMPVTENLMAFGFTHGDGWFGIVDALSCLATEVMDRTGKRIIASQVKEKLGGLRFYMRGGGEFMGGARALGERYSYRVSEVSGRPGVLQVRSGHTAPWLRASRLDTTQSRERMLLCSAWVSRARWTD